MRSPGARTRDLPICRSHRYACPPDARRVERGDYVAWDAPACREAWFAHRLELDRPVTSARALSEALGWWDREHRDARVERRYLCWETPVDRPFDRIPPRYAPALQLGLERQPGPIAPAAPALPIRAADAASIEAIVEAQRRDRLAFGPGYAAHLRWLYLGLAARGATTWAAWDGEVPVAAATVVPGRQEGRFQEVWTAEEHRRRGLATALVAAAVAAHGDRVLRIACEEGSDALGIYTRAGFRATTRLVTVSVSV